jgi:hypothetical protein
MFLPVSMTTLQRQLYRAALSRNFELLASLKNASKDKQKPSGKSLNNILMEVNHQLPVISLSRTKKFPLLSAS